jgi:hypothetical protein
MSILMVISMFLAIMNKHLVYKFFIVVNNTCHFGLSILSFEKQMSYSAKMSHSLNKSGFINKLLTAYSFWKNWQFLVFEEKHFWPILVPENLLKFLNFTVYNFQMFKILMFSPIHRSQGSIIVKLVVHCLAVL